MPLKSGGGTFVADYRRCHHPEVLLERPGRSRNHTGRNCGDSPSRADSYGTRATRLIIFWYYVLGTIDVHAGE